MTAKSKITTSWSLISAQTVLINRAAEAVVNCLVIFGMIRRESYKLDETPNSSLVPFLELR